MNQAGIWLVVKPTVGLPLFLGAVAVTSLVVHASILTHTTWMGAFWQGKAKPAVASVSTGPVTVAANPVAATPPTQ